MRRSRPHRGRPFPARLSGADRPAANRDAAQGLAYHAMDAFGDGRFEQAYRLCLEAVNRWQGCLDAHLLLLEMVQMPRSARIDLLRQLIDVGMTDLGERFIAQNRGFLWLHLEARPLMRTLMQLATWLAGSRAKGAVDEAIETAKQMLTLDQEDHLGVRGQLAAWCIAGKRWDELRELLEQFAECGMLELAWARVILAFATEGEEAATRTLAETLQANPFAFDYLTDRRRHRGPLPPLIEWRGESEAIFAAHHLRPALRAIPEFKAWLRSQKPGAVPPA